MTKTLHQNISETCKRADTLLWDAYARSSSCQPGGSGTGRLVFPRYRNGSVRVSEQEARFAFVEALCQRPLRYSVEVPTSKLYTFKGKTLLSAQTDLQVHDVDESGICNVEFKAKGIPPDRDNCPICNVKDIRSPDRETCPICKDLQKLMREPVQGVWFHLLKSVNNSTIKRLLKRMRERIGKVQKKFGKDIEARVLTIHICMLRHRFSLQKDVLLPIDDAELCRELYIDLCVSRDELTKKRDLNGWNIHKV